METNVLIPAWIMFWGSVVLAVTMIFLGWRFNRWVVGFGIVPFSMLAYYYGLLTFTNVVLDITARSDVVRPALLVLYTWVPALVLNGRLNQFLTRWYNRANQWLTFKHS